MEQLKIRDAKIVNRSMWDVIVAFLKIGTIGFGGGSALIPIIEREVVEDRGWVEEGKFIEHTVAASITPGALPVKLGASIGQEVMGPAGAFWGALSTALPGAVLTIFLVALISSLGESLLHYIEYASIGITMFIILLLFLYVKKVMVLCKNSNNLNISIVIMVFSALFTAGKEIRQLISIIFNINIGRLPYTRYDISTLSLMIVSFFMIFFLSKSYTVIKTIYALLLSYVYIDISGKQGFFHNYSFVRPIVILLMVGSILNVYLRKEKTKQGNSLESIKFYISRIKAVFIFIGTTAVAVIISLIILGKPTADLYSNIEGNQSILLFIIFTFASTITSFGGGEAYVSVADGFYVQNGFVAANVFYSTIVAIANALPGPILVKVASGIAFYFAYSATGKVAAGIIFAIAALLITISVSSSSMILVVSGYDSLKESTILKNLKLYILPVICGMLITTSLSMMYEILKITRTTAMKMPASLALIVGLYGILYGLHKKFHIHDVILIVLAAVSTIIVFSFV
jgi:chromate transporter